MLDLAKLRADTPCDNIYLNHVSTSVPPRQVVEAVMDYFDMVMRCGATSAPAQDFCRKRVARANENVAALIGAHPQEIAFTANGSQAIALVAASLPAGRGDNIVVDEMSFVSNVAPWLRLAERRGAEVRFAPAEKPGVINLEKLDALVNRNTKLICLTHMANNIGILQPAIEVGRIARSRGVPYLLDAANTVGALPVDVTEIGCDFLTASGRKYLRGPAGSGFLYVRETMLETLEPEFAAWNNGTWDYEAGTFTSVPGIKRLFCGEPNFPAIFGLSRAVEYIGEIGGIGAVAERIRALTGFLVQKLLEVPGITVYGPQDASLRAGMAGFNVAGFHFSEIAKYLNGHNVGMMGHGFHCPGVLKLYGIEGVARLCVHCWNTEEEIGAAVDLLRKLAK
ncbi:aminotransferase class V-fold PLP-dependent enzyme [Anaerotruncus rubiinfantis]|uniref:aminotransferase class V-fold PLP-dependent enzyme n=1 Tax=Anaerotruncus rubiinfantis TaxID=1720200 RepID=UPI0034A28AA0